MGKIHGFIHILGVFLAIFRGLIPVSTMNVRGLILYIIDVFAILRFLFLSKGIVGIVV